MKKLITLSFYMLLIQGIFAAATITKSVSNSNPAIGEVFEYNITISNITNLNELGKITDVLDPNLTYLGSNFNSGSTVHGLFLLTCPGSISMLTAPAALSTGTLAFNFPNCAGVTSGQSISFKIYVALNASACGKTTPIDNEVKLFNQSAAHISTSPICKITVNNANPWTIKKTFRSYTGGYLVYDVRFSSSFAEYAFNPFTAIQFEDHFTTDACFNADAANSKVVYVPNESDLTTTIDMTTSGIAVGSGIDFVWSIPPTPTSGLFLSSYLFQVKIKVNCICPATFDLLNEAKVTTTDVCGNPLTLTHQFDMLQATCSGPREQCPPPKTSKKVYLDDNNLNLTQAGCTGYYEIKIPNTTSTFNYTNLDVTDVFPAGITVNTAGIAVTPSSYTSALFPTPGVLFSTSTPLAPGGLITIKIPFTVTTSLPNFAIKNCANVTIIASDGVVTPSTFTQTICDNGITTVPNEVTVATFKKICNPPNHTCGGNVIKTNLPGDTVEYAMHFYNFGTADASNVTFIDVLPNYFNLISTNIYKQSNAASYLPNTCDPSGLTEITSTTSKTVTGQEIKYTLNNSTDTLDKFTCRGVTHYVVKIKAKINLTAPNGTYNNAFKVSYKENSTGLTKAAYSNVVSSEVIKDNLVVVSKTIASHTKNCDTKRDTIEYEIMAVNMGYDPIYIRVKDAISIPVPVSVVNGINTFPIIFQTHTIGGSVSPWANLVSGGALTITSTPTTMNINNFKLDPCSKVLFRYKIVINSGSLIVGQTVSLCNKASVMVGYLSSGISVFDDFRDIKLTTNIESGFKGKNTDWMAERSKIGENIKSETPVKSFKRFGLPIVPHLNFTTFVAIDTVSHPPVCVSITDCLNGNSSSCLSVNGSSYASLKIKGIVAGQIQTTLTIAPGAPKIRQVEYVLSDIRMLRRTCYGPTSWCYHCGVGVNTLFTGATLGPFPFIMSNTPTPIAGINKETNRVVYNAGVPQTISTWNKNFNLPLPTYNCNGNLELVLTAIIYYEDCSICYVSKAYDQNLYKSWEPIPLEDAIIDKHKKLGTP